MKRLDQVEARTIVNAANTPGDAANTFIISAPGSYYITGDVTGDAGKHGISIQADNVTLDLNGFALIGGGGGAFRGVHVPAAQTGFAIRNGTIRGWTDGGVRAELAVSTLAERLRLLDNAGATGLNLGNGSAKDCVASGNATGFTAGNGASIRDCTATGNTTGFSSGDRSHFSNCVSTVNTADGFSCTSFVTLIDCTASRNTGRGIVVVGSSNVVRCNASRNTGTGIVGGTGNTIADCVAGSSIASGGIYVENGSTVRHCTARANAQSGITTLENCHVAGNTCDANSENGIIVLGAGSRVDGNTCTTNTNSGVVAFGSDNLVIRNSAHGNGTNFSFGSVNAAGPIVDMTSATVITSTSPWANFAY
jgi:parallel beta-helix repeat protein